MKKKLLVLLVLCCGLLLVGCNNKNTTNKDNKTKKESAEKKNNPLVGKWEYESGGFIYTFNEDKTGDYNTGGKVLKFTYTIDGDKLSITYTDTEGTFDTTYKVAGNTLIIKDSFNEDVKYIKK